MRIGSSLIIALVALSSPGCSKPSDAPSASNCDVYFSPKGGCTDAITTLLNDAKLSVIMQTSQVPSEKIGGALLQALARGVRVEVILDRSPRVNGYSVADFFATTGITTLIDSQHILANNKTMVIDNHTVVSGSFDFTKAAEDEKADNMLIIRDRTIAEKYAIDWKKHSGHAVKYGKQ